MKEFKLAGRLWADIIIRVRAENREEAWDKLYATDISDIIRKADIDDSDIDPADEEDGYAEARDELYELDLDNTAFDYYLEAIQGLHYGDQASHETHGYKSIENVMQDARRCAEINNYADTEETED